MVYDDIDDDSDEGNGDDLIGSASEEEPLPNYYVYD